MRGRESEEIGVVQIDVEVAALEDALLDVLDGSIGRIVVDQAR